MKKIKKKIKKVVKHIVYIMRRRLTLAKICKICNIDIPKEYRKYKHKHITKIVTSVRAIEPGSLFIKSFNAENAEKHIKLIKDNCVMSIAPNPIKGCRTIITKDVTKNLIDIMNYIKSQNKVKTIAITGSVGKTSTKEMVEKVLQRKYKSKLVSSKGNSNVIFRVVDNLQKVRFDTKVLLHEVGMGRLKGAMKVMGDLLQPDITVFTNIRDSHIEAYGSRENIFKEKSQILHSCGKDSIVLINYDDEILRNHKFIQKRLSYSLDNPKADYYAKDIRVENNTTLFTIVDNIKDREVEAKINVLGDHNVLNAVVAYAVAKQLKIKDNTILRGVKAYKPVGNRQNLIELGKYKVLVDCYNSSYEAIKSIIQVINLIEIKENAKKIAVIGDVLELGDHSKEIHKKIGKLLTTANVDTIIFYGDLVKYSFQEYEKIKSNAKYFSSRNEAIKEIKKILKPDDLILFKASHGMNYSGMIDTLFGTNMGETSEIYNGDYTEENNDVYVYNTYDYKVSIKKYLQNDKKIVLPDNLSNKPVEILYQKAFKDNQNIEEITLPNDLVRIGDSCFENSKITSIIFNENLKIIGKNAFVDCNNIKSIKLPHGILKIGRNAFANCTNLKEVFIPDTVGQIEKNAFSKTNVTIICNEGSYAEKYAINNNLQYKVTK